jgi:CRP-like cAMP-binding protein
MPDIQENLFFAALPAARRRDLARDLEAVKLDAGHLLREPGATVDAVYFPTSSVISNYVQFSDGSRVHVASVGIDGADGLSLALGAPTAHQGSLVQLGGSAYRLPGRAFVAHLQNPTVARVARAFAQARLSLLGQTIACNQIHEVRERTACWLLILHDRRGGGVLNVSHQSLAETVGARRPTTSTALSALQMRGLIAQEGPRRIAVVDRPGLEAASCECYQVRRSYWEAARSSA